MKYKYTNPIKQRSRGTLLCFCFCFLAFVGVAVGQQTPVIATGDDFTAVVDPYGDLYVYGANNPSGPILIEPSGVWTSVSVSPTAYANAHILAIRDNGTLWAWGQNDRGQLGDDSTTARSLPVQVVNIANCVEIACGEAFSMARLSNGAIYVWGDNSYGQVGQVIQDQDGSGIGLPGSSQNKFKVPQAFDASNTYISIAAGSTNGLGVRSDGSMYSWGYSASLQLGLPNIQFYPSIIPLHIGSSNSWTKVFSGADMHFALQTGKLYAWGYGEGSQDGLSSFTRVPNRVGSDSDWATVAIGRTHALGLKTDGSLYGWGDNTFGQLGFPATNSSTGNVSTPLLLPAQAGQTFLAVGAGDEFSTIITDETPIVVKTSGVNDVGQRGGGFTSGGSDFSFENDTIDLRLLYSADLVVSSVAELNVAQLKNLVAGGEFPVSISLANNGEGDITQDFELNAYLENQSNSNQQVQLVFLDGSLVTVGIDAGESKEVGARLQLPASIEHGTYKLVIEGDSGEVLSEITRDNNESSLNDLVFVPDVALSIEVIDAEFSLGESIDIRLTVENVGSWTAIPNFDLSAVLSTTPLYDGLNAQLLAITSGNPTVSNDLDPGESIQVDLSVMIPLGNPDDTFQLVARADDAGALDEDVLTNNDAVAVESFSVGVDLILSSIIVIDPTSPLGSDLDATVFIVNSGSRELTDSFDLGAVLSPTSDFDDPNAIPLLFDGGLSEFEVTTDITSSGSISLPVTFDFPTTLDQGTYYLVVCADPENDVDEIDETNNCVFAANSFELLPDITFDPGMGVVTTPGTYAVGDPMVITLNLNNTGEGTIPQGTEFDIRVILSSTTDLNDPSAVDLFAAYRYTVGASGFTPGVPLQIVLNVDLPRGLLNGDYYLGAIVDINGEIEEQTELSNGSNVVTRPDGEANNVYVADYDPLSGDYTTVVTFLGIDLAEAVDLPGNTFTTDGDGTWFGQDLFFTTDDDAGQSPAIGGGESASFTTIFTDSVVISFDWSSNTSSVENKLVFSIIGGGNGVTDQIAGDSAGWNSVTRLVPAGAQAQWEYIEGVDAVSDVVYVDNIVETTVTAPDLVIDGIDLTDDSVLIESGSYVLLRDPLELTVKTRNQGTATGATDAVLSVYLSTDRTLNRIGSGNGVVPDILISQDTITGGFPAGSPSFTGLVIDLPSDLEPGDYYVITYIDDYQDALGGTIPGSTDPGGQIAEFSLGSFDGEANNIFASADPVVTIVGLADLVVSDVNTVLDPDYYRIVEAGDVNSFGLDFTLTNIGLAPYIGIVESKIVFSRDQVIEASDYTLLNYNYSGGFGAMGSAPANEEFITPDNIDFNPNLVDAGYIGERLFLGIIADSSGNVTELNETNNTAHVSNNDFILSELELSVGLDLNAASIAAAGIAVVDGEPNITNDEVAPYNSLRVPWVGQTTEKTDGVDAITSVIVGDNEISSFSIDINPSNSVLISFWWKVSSQNDTDGRDFLRFGVDGLPAVPDIYGIENGWRKVEIVLPSGAQTLSWSYIKDEDDRVGEDRGWVDQLIITDLPNLTVTGITTDGSASFAPGSSIGTWSVTIQNNGDAIAAETPFDVTIRLLPESNWGVLNSVDLLTITETRGLSADGSWTYDQDSHGDLLLPMITYLQEFYYLGAYVDWSIADEVSGQIEESNETDNTLFTANATIQLGLPDLVRASANPVTGISVTPYEYNTANDDISLFVNLTNGGEGTLIAGSSFDLVVYAAETNDPFLINGSSAYELATVSVTIPVDVPAGGNLVAIPVAGTLPYGISVGNYFLGVIIDPVDTVEEQGGLPTVLVPNQTRDDGEGNNTFFSATASFEISGITLQDALEDVAALNVITTAGDATWFGRSDAGDVLTVDDDQTFTDADGAQSPQLSVGESASFSLLVDTTSVVTFDWAVEGDSDLNELALFLNGVEIRSISGNEPLVTIDPGVLVPDSSILTWVYTKNAVTTGDVAYVDNIELAANDDPDLVLTNIDYTPGTYVLDIAGIIGAAGQKLGTSVLDITVEAENQGEDLSVGTGGFTSADLEVRLSSDRIYGNEDDIVLGSFSQVEGSLDSGELLRYIGGIQLGDTIPEGDYYLIAKIDSNDRVSEFSDLNNVFITENRDVTIEARPRLRAYDSTGLKPRASTDLAFYTDVIEYDEDKLYNPGGTMQVELSINNRGLDDLIDDETGLLQSFINEVYIVAVDREELDVIVGLPDFVNEFEGIVGNSMLLDDFSVQADLKGRRDGTPLPFPDGDIVDIILEARLPSLLQLDTLTAEDKGITNYVYFLRLVIDAPDDILESDSTNVWNNVNIPAVSGSGGGFLLVDFAPYVDVDDGLFSIIDFVVLNRAGWEATYGVSANPVTNPENFLAYAFNRNPASGDTAGNQFPGSYGFDEVDGDPYLSITFDFQYLVGDLEYIVEVSPDLSAWTEVAKIDTITPSGFTEAAGPESLIGDGGLIDSDENIISVLDLGSYARITVIDDESSAGPGTRFMRVTVGVEATPVP